MDPKRFHRKLAAILSADVAGYSRLMQADEAATVKTLEAYKQIISDLVKQHRGRVVDSQGDNLLIEFPSVVDAVQKELQTHNAELPESRRMLFRIGVNLGDVIEEGERIYGDGVNIAARLESLADPGGICISRRPSTRSRPNCLLATNFSVNNQSRTAPGRWAPTKSSWNRG